MATGEPTVNGSIPGQKRVNWYSTRRVVFVSFLCREKTRREGKKTKTWFFVVTMEKTELSIFRKTNWPTIKTFWPTITQNRIVPNPSKLPTRGPTRELFQGAGNFPLNPIFTDKTSCQSLPAKTQKGRITNPCDASLLVASSL